MQPTKGEAMKETKMKMDEGEDGIKKDIFTNSL